jgi:hypothetical protein
MLVTSSGNEIFGRWVDGEYEELSYKFVLENTDG